MLISVEGTSKSQLERGQASMEDAPVLSHCSLLRNPSPKRPVCWCIVVNEKQTVGSPVFRTFLSERIPKAMKDVNIHLFIPSRNSCNFYQPIPLNYTANSGKIFNLLCISIEHLWNDSEGGTPYQCHSV